MTNKLNKIQYSTEWSTKGFPEIIETHIRSVLWLVLNCWWDQRSPFSFFYTNSVSLSLTYSLILALALSGPVRESRPGREII